jgi:DNA-nicking Smr family endonuclease
MKKDKKGGKQKEFRNAPFKGLREFGTLPDQAPGVEVRKAPKPESGTDENDAELFLRHIEGVRKLDEKVSKKPPEGGVAVPGRVAVAKEAEDQRLFLSSLAGMDVTFRDEFPDVEPVHPITVNRMRQLKTGAIRIDLELDLHGLTREEAMKSLGSFISAAYGRGQKAVLVITGKGNNSPAEPVLQGAVASWLREKGKAMVAEFAPAPGRMGGSGAFVIFLKGKKEPIE